MHFGLFVILPILVLGRRGYTGLIEDTITVELSTWDNSIALAQGFVDYSISSTPLEVNYFLRIGGWL